MPLATSGSLCMMVNSVTGVPYPMIIGQVDLSRGINLSQERFITLSIGDRPPRHIDCAGLNPTRTSAQELVDVINRTTGQPIANLTEGPTGQERFLTLQSPDGNTLTLHPWCQVGLPQCWEGTAGRIHRLRRIEDHSEYKASFRSRAQSSFVLLLADHSLLQQGLKLRDNNPFLICHAHGKLPVDGASGATLSQRFPVSAACTYVLKLEYSIVTAPEQKMKQPCGPESAEDPHWELEWLDGAGKSLGMEGKKLEKGIHGTASIPQPWPEYRLTPPQKAMEAEWRLIHPASTSYGLLLRELRLTAGRDATVNGDFSRWEEQDGQNVPVGWVLESGWLDWDTGGRLKLRGDGPEDSVLVQQVQLAEGLEYHLQVRSSPHPTPVETAEAESLNDRARMEIEWQGSGTAVPPLRLPLDGRGFAGTHWKGVVPPGVKQARLRFIQPRVQRDLVVEEVRLEKVEMTQVPLIFLGEAPGQLMINDLKVTYDLPQEPDSPVPSNAASTMLKRSAVIPARPALANQGIEIISNIGRTYGALLARQGIHTVGQLASLETVKVEGLSLRRLAEFRTAAELALQHAAQSHAFWPLAHMSVATLLNQSATELARLSSLPLEEARQLQKSLRVQFLLLDNERLEVMTLGELIGKEPVPPK